MWRKGVAGAIGATIVYPIDMGQWIVFLYANCITDDFAAGSFEQ